MAEHGSYVPLTKVEWTSKNAYTTFKLWRKEVERIIHGPLSGKSNSVKINHIFIWAGAHAESLIEAKLNEDPTIQVNTPVALLNQLGKCLTHDTFFREMREEFYVMSQDPSENVTTFYSRIMDVYQLAEFPENTDFLIVDKLIHGCTNIECKRKMMLEGKTVTVKKCLDILRQQEAIDTTLQRFNTHVDVAYHKPRGSTTRPSTAPQTGKWKCSWCGSAVKHSRDRCPAKLLTCDFCHKVGHFQTVCRKSVAAYQRSPQTQSQPCAIKTNVKMDMIWTQFPSML